MMLSSKSLASTLSAQPSSPPHLLHLLCLLPAKEIRLLRLWMQCSHHFNCRFGSFLGLRLTWHFLLLSLWVPSSLLLRGLHPILHAALLSPPLWWLRSPHLPRLECWWSLPHYCSCFSGASCRHWTWSLPRYWSHIQALLLLLLQMLVGIGGTVLALLMGGLVHRIVYDFITTS